VLIVRADKVAQVKFCLRIVALRSILLLPLLGALAHAAAHKTPKSRDLADTVANSVILTKFSALVRASNLETFLSSRGPFTLFVPTNSAFSKLPPGMFEDLLLPENQTQLQRVILFHLVNGKMWDAKDLASIKSLVSCEGNPLPVRISRSKTQFVLKSRIIHANIKCSNGVIHEIDTMLMPPQVVLISKPPDAAASTNAAPDTNAPPSTETNQAPAGTNAAPSSMKGG